MSADTLADVFDRTAARTPDRVAVREARDWTYRDLRAWSAAVTDLLTREACRVPGRRVALMMPNTAAYVAAFYGIARAGAVIAPLNVRYRSQELRYYLDDTRAAAIVVPPALLPIVEETVAGRAGAPAVLVVDDGGGCTTAVAGGPEGESAAAVAGGSPPLLHQYTSGSTGKPKRVIRTHAQLLFELERLAAVFGLDADDRLLGAAPFTHVNGLVRSMMTAMFVGGTLFPVREFKRREVLDLVTRERLTYFGSVASMFAILADTPVRGPVDLSSLRTLFSASAPLLPADNRRFHAKYGRWIPQLYGSTETGTISVNRGPDLEATLASVGTPLPDVRVDVVDDAGRALPPGAEGEVRIASPGAIRGYDGNPEANATAFRDGWYWSGDLGRLDANGALTLTGRKKLLINRGGFKVNPVEVEEAIASHAKVQEVAVVGAPGLHGDDVVRCVIVAREPCSPDEIVTHCAARIADYKIPSRIEFRTSLPKSETGKLLRHEL
jgi:long-chain acyl-CoA synthetase